MRRRALIPAAIVVAAFGSSALLLAQPPGGSAVPQDAQPGPPAQAAPQQPVTAAQIVDQEFSAYDLDKSGQLDAAEFSAWVSKLRKPATEGAPQTDSQTWSASLFARADTDHNQQVSKAEMTSLLLAAQAQG